MDCFDFYTPKMYSISELVRHLRLLLEEDITLQDVWVQGEISNFSRPSSGHLYFTLKDSGAAVRCVMWKAQGQRLRFSPRDGMLVEAHGSMNVYEAGGQVQLYLDTMRPAGEGALYQEFVRLKARLEAEGLFDLAHKRPIPDHPLSIGVVTSPTGAALQDILDTLRRRMPMAKVMIAPTAVQGADAPVGIIAAIKRLNQQVKPDVILVARGGGSIEDLWAFNDEGVARAIYASEAPVITGVGHETDFTIADFVADLRAPTPTAAAELASMTSMIDLAWDLSERHARLDEIVVREKFYDGVKRKLEKATEQLNRLSPQMKVNTYRQSLDETDQRAERALTTAMHTYRLNLNNLSERLQALDPQAVLQRGYAIITRAADGRVITRVGQVGTDELVKLQLSDGHLHARIQNDEQEKQDA